MGVDMRLEPEIDCRIWDGAGDAVDIRGAGEGVDAGAGEMAGVVEGDGDFARRAEGCAISLDGDVGSGVFPRRGETDCEILGAGDDVPPK